MSTVSGDEATATCPHCEQVNIPSADTPIHKEECCQCFDSDISEGGLNLCLTCFTGGCAGGNNHSGRHFELSKHPIVLNIVKTRLPDAEITLTSDPATGGVKTLEDVKVDDLAPKFEYTRRAYCLACKHHVSTAADVNAKIAKAVAMVLSLEGASVIKDTAFETEKPEKCSHTGDSTKPNNVGLKQVSPLPDLSNAQLAKCTECDLTENLWLCLTCGALACPRKYVLSYREYFALSQLRCPLPFHFHLFFISSLCSSNSLSDSFPCFICLGPMTAPVVTATRRPTTRLQATPSCSRPAPLPLPVLPISGATHAQT